MIGIIGGSGVYEITDKADSIENKVVKTEYGNVDVSFLTFKAKKIAFISRHSSGHSVPPHKVNYRANIQALKDVGVNQVIATNSVGSLNLGLKPGDLVLPDDFLDFTTKREKTFFHDEVVHVDVTTPYCSRLRSVLESCCDLKNGSTLVCTEGPRFETPAEVKMFATLGADLVNMTSVPEVVLAREREMCYASICIVSNYVAGISPYKLTMNEIFVSMAEAKEKLLNLFYDVINKLEDDFDCECLHALEESRV